MNSIPNGTKFKLKMPEMSPYRLVLQLKIGIDQLSHAKAAQPNTHSCGVVWWGQARLGTRSCLPSFRNVNSSQPFQQGTRHRYKCVL